MFHYSKEEWLAPAAGLETGEGEEEEEEEAPPPKVRLVSTSLSNHFMKLFLLFMFFVYRKGRQ